MQIYVGQGPVNCFAGKSAHFHNSFQMCVLSSHGVLRQFV